jgi:Ca2+/Na+ antiporter
MENKQKSSPPSWMVYVSIAIAFLWLLFVGLWLFLYAGDYSFWQNIGIVIVSLAAVAILETALWLPWGMKQPDRGKS